MLYLGSVKWSQKFLAQSRYLLDSEENIDSSYYSEDIEMSRNIYSRARDYNGEHDCAAKAAVTSRCFLATKILPDGIQLEWREK